MARKGYLTEGLRPSLQDSEELNLADNHLNKLGSVPLK
jgi:hypothetical protein